MHGAGVVTDACRLVDVGRSTKTRPTRKQALLPTDQDTAHCRGPGEAAPSQAGQHGDGRRRNPRHGPTGPASPGQGWAKERAHGRPRAQRLPAWMTTTPSVANAPRQAHTRPRAYDRPGHTTVDNGMARTPTARVRGPRAAADQNADNGGGSQAATTRTHPALNAWQSLTGSVVPRLRPTNLGTTDRPPPMVANLGTKARRPTWTHDAIPGTGQAAEPITTVANYYPALWYHNAANRGRPAPIVAISHAAPTAPATVYRPGTRTGLTTGITALRAGHGAPERPQRPRQPRTRGQPRAGLPALTTRQATVRHLT